MVVGCACGVGLFFCLPVCVFVSAEDESGKLFVTTTCTQCGGVTNKNCGVFAKRLCWYKYARKSTGASCVNLFQVYTTVVHSNVMWYLYCSCRQNKSIGRSERHYPAEKGGDRFALHDGLSGACSRAVYRGAYACRAERASASALGSRRGSSCRRYHTR